MQISQNLIRLTGRSIAPARCKPLSRSYSLTSRHFRLHDSTRITCSAKMGVQWRDKLDHALANNKDKMPYAKYYQVATVRSDGRPANRTVVHRGFYGQGGLEWVTDVRSSKVEEVKQNPNYEAAWYFEGSREQFRLTGQMTIVGEDHGNSKLLEERQRVWSSLSPGGRGQFNCPDPGLPRQPGDEHLFKQDPPPEDSKPLDVFCLVVMEVDMVDYLNLFEMRRVEYRSSKGPDGKRQWECKDVNP